LIGTEIIPALRTSDPLEDRSQDRMEVEGR
jgi:hypothetical protein